MGRAALSQAHRLYTLSETLLASSAQANIPYAVEILMLLQFVDLLIARSRSTQRRRSFVQSAEAEFQQVILQKG